MIQTIIEAIALAYDMIDGLIEAAKQAGATDQELTEQIAAARARRKAQLAKDQADERSLLP